MRAAEPEVLEGIEGIGPTIAGAVHAWFANPRNARLVDDLVALGVTSEAAPAPDAAEGPLTGWTVVVTGTLAGMTRDEAHAALEALGARTTSSVSGRTSLVVAGTEAGSKLDRALALGVPVADEAALRHLLVHGRLPDAG
jgi:DNA ligase (NAD+)